MENWIFWEIKCISFTLLSHSIVGGRISEAMRVAKAFSSERKQVYVYIRYVYTDSLKYLSDVSGLFVKCTYTHCWSWCSFTFPHGRAIFWWFFKWQRISELTAWYCGDRHLTWTRGECGETETSMLDVWWKLMRTFCIKCRKKCEGFDKYLQESMGPIAQSFATPDITVSRVGWVEKFVLLL